MVTSKFDVSISFVSSNNSGLESLPNSTSIIFSLFSVLLLLLMYVTSSNDRHTVDSSFSK